MHNGPSPDTIAAVATAPGPAGLAVVRISGAGATDIFVRLCPGLDGPPSGREPRLVRIRNPRSGEEVDRVLATCFRAPASYTGEDVVELSGHGGWLTPRLVLEACLDAGAREAEPGEFTRRAYLNGKLDLVQAEAVLDLVEARSRAFHRAALQQVERGLSERIGELRERLVGLEALLGHHIDFPEEDEPPVSVERIVREARGVEEELGALARSAPEGELLREGALVVLAGRPNSGKSSLFNALVGHERAIVTEVPGTTRDALEAVVSLGRYPFRLVDTAGLRATADVVEERGVEVARRYLGAADLVLFCHEAGSELGREERAFVDGLETPVVRVATKADLREGAVGTAGEPEEDAPRVMTSVRDGRGLGDLRELLPRLVYRTLITAPADAPVLTRGRQARGVERAAREVAAFADALQAGVPAEVASAHVRAAESALEDVVGTIAPEEVLERLFGEFCIGK